MAKSSSQARTSEDEPGERPKPEADEATSRDYGCAEGTGAEGDNLSIRKNRADID